MKKIAILTIAAGLTLAVGSVYGQGTIYLNNFDANIGLVLGLSGNTPAPAGTQVEVFGGASAGSLAPLTGHNSGNVIYTLVAGDVNGISAGHSSFDNSYAVVSTVAPSAVGFFQVVAWQGGGGTLATAQYVYTSAIFSEATGTNPGGSGQPIPATLNIPGTEMRLTPVPEPTTIALGGLGAVALLLFRRRK